MVRRTRPPSVGDTMVSKAGLLMVVAVVGLGALAQWGHSSGRTWLLWVAGLAAPVVVVLANHAGSKRPPRETP